MVDKKRCEAINVTGIDGLAIKGCLCATECRRCKRQQFSSHEHRSFALNFWHDIRQDSVVPAVRSEPFKKLLWTLSPDPPSRLCFNCSRRASQIAQTSEAFTAHHITKTCHTKTQARDQTSREGMTPGLWRWPSA